MNNIYFEYLHLRHRREEMGTLTSSQILKIRIAVTPQFFIRTELAADDDRAWTLSVYGRQAGPANYRIEPYSSHYTISLFLQKNSIHMSGGKRWHKRFFFLITLYFSLAAALRAREAFSVDFAKSRRLRVLICFSIFIFDSFFSADIKDGRKQIMGSWPYHI